MMSLALRHPLDWNNELGRLFATPHYDTSCEVVDGENAYKITLDVPGFKKEDLEIEVKDRKLHIKGVRKESVRQEKDRVLHQERQFGEFYRQFSLPEGIADDQTQAKVSDGVLEVVLPKTAIEIRKIAIN